MMKRYNTGLIPISFFLFIPALIIAGAPSSSHAQTESCITDSCHASIITQKVVHSAAKDGCTICHQVTEDPAGKHPGNRTITLVQQGADLCYMCHEPKNKKKTVHAPVMGGDCTTCHNPHSSPNRAMLRDTAPGLCFQCHPDSMIKQKFVHPPAASGDCSVCHDNHESDFPKRLVMEEPALCFQCHTEVEKNLKTGKSVHPPVQQACTTCHNPHGSSNKAMLNAPVPSLCYNCHEPKNTKKVVHEPIQGGDCLTCHNPHQSANRGMLKQAVPQLCFQCHDESMVQQKVVHPPVAAGECSDCHDNHQSDYPFRLLQDVNGVCFTCHPDKEEGVKTKKSVHPPVRQSCVQCHNPHSSPNKAVLNAPVPSLCATCHPDKTASADMSLTKHGPMIDARTCMNCHDPHFSDTARLLQKPEEELCLSCHDKKMSTESGEIMDMKAWLTANPDGHGPVKEKECVTCHDPHGSQYWRILKRYYPADFYTSYSDGKYDLCFSCHDKAAFSSLRAGDSTNFRNGNKNLHFVHVNKPVKGRTCRACHEVHADTGIPHHIKERVEFSGWSMPINYSPGKNGGSCAPGCHGEKTYTR